MKDVPNDSIYKRRDWFWMEKRLKKAKILRVSKEMVNLLYKKMIRRVQ